MIEAWGNILVRLTRKCPNCGKELPKHWTDVCPNCGYKLTTSEIQMISGTVIEKLVGPNQAESVSAANATVSYYNDAYSDARLGLDALRRTRRVPEELIKPLESSIKRLDEERKKAEQEREIAYKVTNAKKLDDYLNKQDNMRKQLDELNNVIVKGFQNIGDKVDGIANLLERISKKMPTKQDLKEVEERLIAKQDILQQHMDELAGFTQEIKEKVGIKESSRFRKFLDKLSSVKGAMEFALLIRELIEWVATNDTLWRIILPFIGKILTGG